MNGGPLHTKRLRQLIVAALAIVVVLVSACTAQTFVMPDYESMRAKGGVQRIPVSRDTLDIYEVVLRRLVGPDLASGGKLKPRIIYIVRRTDDSVGAPRVTASRSASPTAGLGMLGSDAQFALSARLKSLGDVVWVDGALEAKIDPKAGQRNVIVTLGSISSQSAQRAMLPAKIFIPPSVNAGHTYIMEKAGGVWRIIGTTAGDRIG